MPWSKKCPSRVVAVLALALGIVPARVGLGQTSPSTDPVPRIAQTPQSPTTPTKPEPVGQPVTPGAAPVPPGPTTPVSPPTEATQAIREALEPGFGGTQSAALGGAGAAVAYNQGIGGLGGYIDSAVPRSNIRLRYDDAYDMNRPDRAEYFYPQCGCYFFAGGKQPFSNVAQRDAVLRAFGPTNANGRVNNYQEYSTYVEFAPLANMSAFVEVPVRYIDPQANHKATGFGDMNLGFKYAFIAQPDAFYTFQFKTYVPTGAGSLGLGTNHPSLEPGILAFQRLSERFYFLGEFRDWIPINGSTSIALPGKPFAGNILNYGLGVFYNLVLTDNFRVAPISEFVGWTVLGGYQTTAKGIQSAASDTIVNMKIGVRFGLGDYNRPGGGSQLNDRASLYVGYAHCLTQDFWYKDMLRVELIWYY
jgi:hypothetical protein